MYFPYLRGRQYELLALRELLEKGLMGLKIIPIIEPVKLSPTLINTLDLFSKSNHNIAVILNPQVGGMSTDIKDIKKDEIKQKYLDVLDSTSITKSFIGTTQIKRNVENSLSRGYKKQDLLIINNDPNPSFIAQYLEEFETISPKYNVILDESAFRRRIKKNRVLLDDKFEKKDRNSDYSISEDEFFSDDHLYFATDGYLGFSDYSIVGKTFSEAGYAPYAVAIHIVYFDDDKNLRIRHFVSDTNEDMHDPATKFHEAVTKLAKWKKAQKRSCLDTYGVNELIHHYETETYPGLGSVKKLAIMHHVELISKYLDEAK